MASTDVICTSIYHTKQLNPWPNSPASCVVVYSQLAACPVEMEPFKDHPSTHGCLTGLTQKQTTTKAAWITFSTDMYLADMLGSVYVQLSCDGKNISCCYVRGGWVFSNPVTYISKQSVTVTCVQNFQI